MLIKLNDSGTNVQYLQYGLRIKCFYTGSIDGQFGTNTYNAVKNYQSSKGLSSDGIVGDNTWNALNSLSGGSTGGNTGNTNGAAGNKASANLIYFIKKAEGFAPSLYRDPVGVLTGGYGMTGAELNGLPGTISEATATLLLTNHVNNEYYTQVLNTIHERGVANPLQREVDGFTSFAYNLGVGAFQGSTLLKLYASGSRGEDIHNEFKKWVYAGGRVLPGLVTRREEEWGIFGGSSARIEGYNCPPSIAYINTSGNPTGQVVKDNNGYGANPC